MPGYQITGKVVKIYKTQQVTETFKKREIVIEDATNPQYPEYAVIQFGQDRCALLDNYKAGDVVTVDFNIKGRAYQKPMEETKYFTSLGGWKISGTGTAKPADPSGASSIAGPPAQDNGSDDDMPF